MPRFSYQPRPITFQELWEHRGWRMKLYGLAYGRPRPEPILILCAKQLAAPVLDAATGGYGVGFMGVHQGRTSHFVFVDWWDSENELNHHVFISSLDDPMSFRDATATGVMACVWDLAVIGFERQAWIDTVLRTGGEDDFAGYLARRLEGDI